MLYRRILTWTADAQTGNNILRTIIDSTAVIVSTQLNLPLLLYINDTRLALPGYYVYYDCENTSATFAGGHSERAVA
jgi:hypothetical protein